MVIGGASENFSWLILSALNVFGEIYAKIQQFNIAAPENSPHEQERRI